MTVVCWGFFGVVNCAEKLTTGGEPLISMHGTFPRSVRFPPHVLEWTLALDCRISQSLVTAPRITIP
jgi:hypothetical protein